MPGAVEKPEFSRLSVRKLHPTFAAEIGGVDWTNVDDETLEEIKAAVHKYGVCVFRDTGLDDTAHVEFSRRLGELDDVKRYLVGGRALRYKHYELFDAGNLDEENNLLDPDSPRAHANRGNQHYHSDSTFNPRRSSYSLLRAVTLPPPGTGGNTSFADARTAYASLPAAVRSSLEAADYVGQHTFAQSRKLGSPAFFSGLDPASFKAARHRLVQTHAESGRRTLVVGAHLYRIEGLTEEESDGLRDYLNEFVAREEFVVGVQWERPGDMIVWDNRCTLHKAEGGSFQGVHRRDLRRTTVHDSGEAAWGLNEVGVGPESFSIDMRREGDAPMGVTAS